VLRHAPDEETAYKILENRLYHNITARFVQSHDYIRDGTPLTTCIRRAGTTSSSSTPHRPATPIDFLEAPNRMADFFGGRLLRWLIAPYRLAGRRGARVVNFASRPFYQLADRVLGSQFLQDIAEFFLNFQTMYDGFIARAQAVERLLHDRRTSSRWSPPSRGRRCGRPSSSARSSPPAAFPLGAIVLNRVLPDS